MNWFDVLDGAEKIEHIDCKSATIGDFYRSQQYVQSPKDYLPAKAFVTSYRGTQLPLYRRLSVDRHLFYTASSSGTFRTVRILPILRMRLWKVAPSDLASVV